MTIRVKYWAPGASSPSSWTSLVVDSCYPRYVYREYNGVQGIDGQQIRYKRRWLAITITVGPAALTDATNGPLVEALANSVYARVEDTRHAAIGTNNTVDCTVVSAQRSRAGESLATESITIEIETVGTI